MPKDNCVSSMPLSMDSYLLAPRKKVDYCQFMSWDGPVPMSQLTEALFFWFGDIKTTEGKSLLVQWFDVANGYQHATDQHEYGDCSDLWDSYSSDPEHMPPEPNLSYAHRLQFLWMMRQVFPNYMNKRYFFKDKPPKMGLLNKFVRHTNKTNSHKKMLLATVVNRM